MERNCVLSLESDGTETVKWSVESAFVVHHDTKSHTSGVMKMGKVALYSASNKQKLNTKSLTEAYLVGVDDPMSQILWMRYFLEAQRMNIYDNVIYQDNQSATNM